MARTYPTSDFQIMSDLTRFPTATLQAMKNRLTNWIVYLAFIDGVVVVVFVWFVVNRSPRAVMPFAPVALLPAIALVPLLGRASAIKRELDRRAD